MDQILNRLLGAALRRTRAAARRTRAAGASVRALAGHFDCFFFVLVER